VTIVHRGVWQETGPTIRLYFTDPWANQLTKLPVAGLAPKSPVPMAVGHSKGDGFPDLAVGRHGESCFPFDSAKSYDHTGRLVPSVRRRDATMKPFFCCMTVLILVVDGARDAKAQVDYVYTTLGVPGSSFTVANGINASGQIVGYYSSDAGLHGFLLSGGNYTTLDAPGAVNTLPYATNNVGQIVGYYNDVGGLPHGFLLSGGAYTPVEVPGSSSTYPSGINDRGQIVGLAADGSFLYSGGRYTSINVPGSMSTTALGINNAGQIVGYYQDANRLGHGFLLSGDTYTSFDVPGAVITQPMGINNLGQIAGWYDVTSRPSGVLGFLLSDGIYTTLDPPGTLGIRVNGINDAAQIVGTYSPISEPGPPHGFVATPVPEPATLLLLAIGTLGVMGWAWQRKGRGVTWRRIRWIHILHTDGSGPARQRGGTGEGGLHLHHD
jgi:probable HAF family extracellular repeat protein